jgi:glycosyltransferase involved in cell wall biosynthesis
MRIVVNGWFLNQLTTGSGQYLTALMDWLPRAEQHEFILVTPARASRSPGHASRFTSHVLPGWQVVSAATPFDRLNRDLAKLWFEQIAFPAACRRLRAGAALVPYWGAPWWRACPTVVTVHDLIPLLLPLYRGGFPQRAYTGLVARTARRAQAVLTDSEASRRDVISHLHIPQKRVRAVHLATAEHFAVVDDPGLLARVRAKYDLPAEPFFLYLGGFDARKNVVRMIQAFAMVTEDERPSTMASGVAPSQPDARQPMLQLVVAGKLPEHDSAFAPDPRIVVERLGIGDRVRFTGWVDESDKPALCSLARGALYLSEYEGFGLPVLEAMASGCPVVAGGG